MSIDLHALWAPLSMEQWLGVPLLIATVVALFLWTGRVRQPGLVNTLALGLLLPTVNLSLIMAGALLFTQQAGSISVPTLASLLG